MVFRLANTVIFWSTGTVVAVMEVLVLGQSIVIVSTTEERSVVVVLTNGWYIIDERPKTAGAVSVAADGDMKNQGTEIDLDHSGVWVASVL